MKEKKLHLNSAANLSNKTGPLLILLHRPSNKKILRNIKLKKAA